MLPKLLQGCIKRHRTYVEQGDFEYARGDASQQQEVFHFQVFVHNALVVQIYEGLSQAPLPGSTSKVCSKIHGPEKAVAEHTPPTTPDGNCGSRAHKVKQVSRSSRTAPLALPLRMALKSSPPSQNWQISVASGQAYKITNASGFQFWTRIA